MLLKKIAISLFIVILCPLSAQADSVFSTRQGSNCFFSDNSLDIRGKFADFDVRGKDRRGSVTYAVKDRMVTNISIRESNSDTQVMASLIDYVASISPIDDFDGKREQIEAFSSINSNSWPLCDALDTIDRKKYVLLREIPLTAHMRYPNISLKADRSFRAVPISAVTPAFIKNIRQPWVEFFRSHKTATARDLDTLAEQIAKAHADHFLEINRAKL